MKLSDARENYYYQSGKLGEIGRQLAFAGIAVIWIFKTEGFNNVPRELVLPALFFVAALAFDYFQYVYATIAWGLFHRVKEVQAAKTKDGEQDDFKAPRSINWPSVTLLWLKVFLLAGGYMVLLRFLSSKLL